ncbi:50S ribosomal protein L22 [Listeria monocytogenes]|nr:50S ribosomal protein L22 [Listeria monocytogenes]
MASTFVDCTCTTLCTWTETFKCWTFVNKCFLYYKVVNV